MSSVDDVQVHEEHGPTAAPAPLSAASSKLDLPPDFPANAAPISGGGFRLTFEYPAIMRSRGADQRITEKAVTSLDLHRLKGKHQKEMRRADVDDMTAQMIASSARMDLGEATLLADEMDAVDLASVTRIIRFFTTPGRLTGRSS